MRNLSDVAAYHSKQQKDRTRYENISQEGAQNYVLENFAKPSPEDIATLARIITQLRSATAASGGLLGRHIDVGTGTSPISLLTAPFVNEIVCIERSPSNIATMRAWLQSDKQPAHLRVWQEVAAIVYAIGGESGLKRLILERDDIFRDLKNWSELSTVKRAGILRTLIPKPEDNPYLSLDFQATLRKKVRFVKGDIIEGVTGDAPLGLADLRPYAGTADYLTMFSCAESISADLLIVLHVLVTWSHLGKPGALVFQQGMAQTMGYEGFFTPAEKASNAPLEECYITLNLFREILDKLVLLDSGSDQGIVFDPAHPLADPVRPGYGGMTGFRGTVRRDVAATFQDGAELLDILKEELREVQVKVKNKTLRGYCLADEVDVVKNDLQQIYQASPVSVVT